jgi:hypothetical protein
MGAGRAGAAAAALAEVEEDIWLRRLETGLRR